MFLTTKTDVADIAAEDGHWLAGLTDGEGCFSLYTRRRRLDRYPDRVFHAIGATFKISLRADDVATLYRVCEILKLGGVGKPEGKNRNPVRSFRANNRQDLLRVIACFDRFPLRSKKATDFRTWRKALLLYENSIVTAPRKTIRKGIIERLSSKKRRPLQSEMRRFYTIPPDIWEQLDRLADELKAGRRYVGHPTGL